MNLRHSGKAGCSYSVGYLHICIEKQMYYPHVTFEMRSTMLSTYILFLFTEHWSVETDTDLAFISQEPIRVELMPRK